MTKIFIISLLLFDSLFSDTIRVGIYENPPKIFFDTDKKPQGIYVKLLEDFALQYSHTLVFKACSWNECLEQLENSQIDIMPDVAQTPVREERFSFPKEIILSSWSIVYRKNNVKIDSILDLDTKNVALLKNSIQSEVIRKYTQKFSIRPNFIEVDSFDAIFTRAEPIDAFVTNRFYTHQMIEQELYTPTDILIEPSVIKFAFTKHDSDVLRNQLDAYIHQLKNEPDSLYHKELTKLLQTQQKYKIPQWISYSAVIALFILILLVLIIVLFKTLLRKKQEEIEKNLVKDSLTQLPSRYKLMLDLQKFPMASLAIINIDNFREINDFFGYQFGDATIVKLATKITSILQQYPEQEFYHLQGDEFALLSHDTSKNYFIATINDVLTQINSHDFKVLQEEVSLQITAGISCRQESHSLLAKADMALKQAKKDRKNFAFFHEEATTTKEYENNLLWTKKLKNAIKDGRISVYYQPIIVNTTKKCLKYESLIRLIDTDGSTILPVHFLSIAKRTKHYIKLTQIVIEKSFETFASLHYEFAINLTIEDILDNDLPAFLIEKLESYPEPWRVTFEIVESEGIENFEQVVTFIKKIKSYGCKLAIDDFGTGYSNFEYLIHLQADIIKIDGSLIRHIHENQNARAVVASIVSFAKNMQIQTIAEYVANEEIFMACRELGIDYSQGYHFSQALEKPSYESM